MSNVSRIASCLMVSALVTPACAGAFTVEGLTTNSRVDPLGIPAGRVTLGWVNRSDAYGFRQTAYRIRVGLTPGTGDVWDSDRVASDRQIGIELPDSLRLNSATRYYWQVRSWDAAGVESEWSKPAWFETGLTADADWAGAKWIGAAAAARPAEVQWADYAVTVDFKIDNAALGVLLRASSDGANGYMSQINVSGPTPKLVLHRKNAGQYEVVAATDLAPLGFTNDALKASRHRVEFTLQGDRLTTTLDGKRVDEREDAAFKTGTVGLRTYGAERGTVYGISVTEIGSGKKLLSCDFGNGVSPFGQGRVRKNSLTVSGSTEAVYGAAPARLPIFRGTFDLKKPVQSARAYASAHGIYELSLNGKKAGDQSLAPGWTDYHQRVNSQTYDITSLIVPGRNTIGAAVADGWYKGKVGINWREVYGDTLALIAKVKITYADGSVEWFGTGADWKSAPGPVVTADLQDGETYDAGYEQPNWDAPAFDASTWGAVQIVFGDVSKLRPQPDEPVRVTGVLNAKQRTQSSADAWIYDLGQNTVGVARIKMTGKKGRTVEIRYAEELYRTGDRRGQIYTDNFRSARVTDYYTFAQDGTATYEPKFTQHGFRYVQISGLDTPPAVDDVKGVVLGSDLPDTGTLETSDAMLNQLVRNIRWGQRGNFVSIPTDTPARDERLGWTGDISVFAPTASFLQDTRGFLSKWMDDVRDSQREDGNIPAVVPQPRREFDSTGVGWSDAFVTVPYAVWRATGDDRIVRQNWTAMKKFYDFVHTSATRDGNLLEEGRTSFFSGDWLSLEKVDRLEEHKVIATAYFAENTRMMAEMAAAVGDTDLARKCDALLPQIRRAFADAYVNADGLVYTGTQTAYAMALGLDLIADPAKRENAAHKFIDRLAADNYHLRTGFLGTPCLLPALTKIGRQDLAFRLLLNDDYPSWGFEIKMGATTMWERWNTIRPNGEFGPVEMNSFNHYAYGAVGDWMARHIGGLQLIEPGYKVARIAPAIGGGGLTSAKATLRTGYGTLACEWALQDRRLTLNVTVPPNTTARLIVPEPYADSLRHGNAPAKSAEGVTKSSDENGALVLDIGSGHYAFTAVADTAK